MGSKRATLSLESLGERIVPDATPAPPLTFEQVENVLVTEQAILGEVEADIKLETNSLLNAANVSDKAALAYWVPKLTELVASWSQDQADYAADSADYVVAAVQARHDIPADIANFSPNGVEVLFGVSPVGGVISLPSAGTMPVSIPVMPPVPPPVPRSVFTPEETPNRVMMKAEAALLQTRLQLVAIATELLETRIALDQAKKAGNGALAAFLQGQIDELEDRRDKLVDAYKKLLVPYTKLAGLLGHEVPDAIKNFDPDNIPVWV